MKIDLTPVPVRGCGECALCCKVLGVKEGEFHKPHSQWCPHVRKGKGCSIYDTRPTPCRDFMCLWLSCPTWAPEALRPDKIHGVFSATPDGRHILLYEDPGYPGDATRACKAMLDAYIRDGSRYVIVICGPKRTFFGNPALFAQAVGKANEEVPDGRTVAVEGP